MEKIDRLGWAAGFAFTAYGLRVGVRTNTHTIREQLEACWPPGWRPAPAGFVDRLYSLRVGRQTRTNVREFTLLYEDVARVSRTLKTQDALADLETRVKMFVAEWARRRVFVHAGAVGWRGRAILLPGRTFTGKTSLVAELVKAGATYYSDEYAVLDAAGRVHPFAQPLAIRANGTGEQTKVPVEQFGGIAGARPLPVGMVLITHHRAGARWRARSLSAGQGVLEILRHTVAARRRPDEVFGTLRKVVARARVLKGARGEANQLVDELLSSDRFGTPTWRT